MTPNVSVALLQFQYHFPKENSQKIMIDLNGTAVRNASVRIDKYDKLSKSIV